ncbi:MAG: hypothetical protein N3D79_05615 [Acidilobaceae archaeon]|nr:hypothetical protein [Acidilobaceae archaeon]
MRRKIVSKRYLTVYEARAILEERKKEKVRELQERVWEYLSLFPTIELQRVREAYEHLRELGLSEEIAVNLLNICPENEEEVKLIISAQKDISFEGKIIESIISSVRHACAPET